MNEIKRARRIRRIARRKRKQYRLVAFSSILFIVSMSNVHGYHADYEILNDANGAYATYGNGNVYIGDEEYIDSLEKNNNDVYIIDEREELQNMKVLNSYRITDSNYRRDIINIMEDYENRYPSEWDRSEETMITEWAVHNTLYGFNYQTDRTQDVDFENTEEEQYKNLALKIFFR